MALERPEAGYQWCKVPVKGHVDVVVTGECYCWWCHWTGGVNRKLNRAVRCLRKDHGECSWCAAGYKANCRYVLPVRTGARNAPNGDVIPPRDELLELSRVAYPVLDLMEQTGGLLGRRVRLTKAWDAVNARIDLEPLGREHVSAELVRDIQEIVLDLGRAELAARPGPVIRRSGSEERDEREVAAQRRVVNPPRTGYGDR